jgi:hypothetical protein
MLQPLKASIDSAEQEIPRPKNKIKIKSYYSDKKKKHTVKTQYLVTICTKLVMMVEGYMTMKLRCDKAEITLQIGCSS